MRKNLFITFIIVLVMIMSCLVSAQAKETTNLNDGVYTYGRFDKNGYVYDKDTPPESCFRSANYLPVEGGRTITCYFAKAEWNNYNIGLPIYVVEYDLGKNIIGSRQSLTSYYPADRIGLLLNERTAYIRIAFARYDTAITTPLDAIELAVYYTDEYVDYFVPSYSFNTISEDQYYLDPLYGKTIVYDGDDIAESRLRDSYNGGAYPVLIADQTNGHYINLAVTGAFLTSTSKEHSVVDNLKNLPLNGDLYCFEGGINDFWANVPLGDITPSYADPLDTTTICGAMEQIFQYCQTNFPGKPIVFVIPHKIRITAIKPNANGDTFQDYHDAMVAVCNKYSVPYYDAFLTSGLNGWNTTQSNTFLTANPTTTGDGIHPNEEGYRRYYVPQMLSLFRSIVAE